MSMAIPVSTTTITTYAPAAADDAYDEKSFALLDEGVRAVISEGSGSRTTGQDKTESYVTHRLTCDPTPLFSGYRVIDTTTGLTYTVIWSTPYSAPAGLSHTSAGLQAVAHG